MASSLFEIKEINHTQTWELRKKIFRPYQPITNCKCISDIEPSTMHFGVFNPDSNNIIGVASINKEPFIPRDYSYEIQNISWRLRGLAVDTLMHEKNIDTLLLNRCFNHIQSKKKYIFDIDGIWCNAKTEFLDFYKKNKFVSVGNEFLTGYLKPHFQIFCYL